MLSLDSLVLREPLLLLSPLCQNFGTGLIVYHGDKAFKASILAGSIWALRCGGCNKSRVLMVFQPRDPRRAIGECYDATALQIPDQAGGDRS